MSTKGELPWTPDGFARETEGGSIESMIRRIGADMGVLEVFVTIAALSKVPVARLNLNPE
jgi:hypothetical protein